MLICSTYYVLVNFITNVFFCFVSQVGETDEDMAAAGGKVTWDGHSSTADAAAKQARQNISLEEQIAQIHRQKGTN